MLGWGELVLIIVIAVLFLGPDKLTDFARQLGKLYAEYKKAKRMIELEVIYGYKTLSDDDVAEELKKKYEEIRMEVERLADIRSSEDHPR